jgi:uncharacterized membrane protein YedE/YeeE
MSTEQGCTPGDWVMTESQIYIAAPLGFIILVMAYLMYVVDQKRKAMIRLNNELDQQLVKNNHNIARQLTVYMIRLGDQAMWAPEHTLKPYEEPGKD